MWGFIGNIGPWELVLILLVALIVVGPGKLPEVARSLGKAVNQFQKATTGVKREIEEAIRLDDKPGSAADINIKPDKRKEENIPDTSDDVDLVEKEDGKEYTEEDNGSKD